VHVLQPLCSADDVVSARVLRADAIPDWPAWPGAF
jgi:hypothetical protein